VDVSFNRPYGKYCQILDAPLPTGSGEWFLWEFPMAYWMEAQGYDLTYVSNMDTGSTQDAPGKLNGGNYTATIYSGPKGNFVFNASTCWWADSLAEPPGYVRPSVYTTPKGPDPRAQRITANVLKRLRGSR
jgi:hypothetical protein